MILVYSCWLCLATTHLSQLLCLIQLGLCDLLPVGAELGRRELVDCLLGDHGRCFLGHQQFGVGQFGEDLLGLLVHEYSIRWPDAYCNLAEWVIFDWACRSCVACAAQHPYKRGKFGLVLHRTHPSCTDPIQTGQMPRLDAVCPAQVTQDGQTCRECRSHRMRFKGCETGPRLSTAHPGPNASPCASYAIWCCAASACFRAS